MSKRPSSTKLRRLCFDRHKFGEPPRMKCYRCPTLIGPHYAPWECEHLIPRAAGGSDEPDNLYPICLPCHREKTKVDRPHIAKVQRIEAKFAGLKQSSRPMPGSKRSPFKKKMSGKVEYR